MRRVLTTTKNKPSKTRPSTPKPKYLELPLKTR